MSRSESSVRSLSDAVREVREQVEAHCFVGEERAFAEELCLIIAEVYCLEQNMKIKIGTDVLTCGFVAEVYTRLKGEHIRAVTDKFFRVDYPIRHKKTYLRTLLYNQVFEQESGEINGFRSEFLR